MGACPNQAQGISDKGQNSPSENISGKEKADATVPADLKFSSVSTLAVPRTLRAAATPRWSLPLPLDAMAAASDDHERATRSPGPEITANTLKSIQKSHLNATALIVQDEALMGTRTAQEIMASFGVNPAVNENLDSTEEDAPDMPLRDPMPELMPEGRRVASIDMRHELKTAVIGAYTALHARGMMHGKVRLENILLGINDEVTLVSLESAATIYRKRGDKLPLCSEADLEEEMLAVKHLLQYEDYILSRPALARESQPTKSSSPMTVPDMPISPSHNISASGDDGGDQLAPTRSIDITNRDRSVDESTTPPTPFMMSSSGSPSQPISSFPLVAESAVLPSSTNPRKRRRGDSHNEPLTHRFKSVAFHPDTLDNGIWATGMKLKKDPRRTSTPEPNPDDALYWEPAPDPSANGAISPTASASSHKLLPVVIDAAIGDLACSSGPNRLRSASPPASVECTVRISTPNSTVGPRIESAYTSRINSWNDPSEFIDAEACYGPPRAIVVTSPSGAEQVWRFPQALLRQITTFLSNQVNKLTSSTGRTEASQVGYVPAAPRASRKRLISEDHYPQHLSDGRPQKRGRTLHIEV